MHPNTRVYSLWRINEKVSDAQVAKGTDIYPETDDSDSESDDLDSESESDDTEEIAGRVTRWYSDRGYGIITANDADRHEAASSATYFFHISNFDTEDSGIQVGDAVHFYESYNEAKGRWEAHHVVLAGDE